MRSNSSRVASAAAQTNIDARCNDSRLCPRLDRRPGPHQPARPIEGRRMRAHLSREDQRRDGRSSGAAKKLDAVAHGDVVLIPAVDRLSRDTTDLLVIARELQKAGAGLRSIAEPVVDTTSDFAELVLAMLGVAAKLERRRIKERTERGRADAKAKGVKFGRKPKLTEHQRREAIKRRDKDGE